MFRCPMAIDKYRVGISPGDTTLIGQGTMMVVSIGPVMTHFWSTNTDFAFNEAIFGYDYRPQNMRRRLGGNLGRITRPSEVVLVADALPAAIVDPMFASSFPYPWITFAPSLTSTGPVTLADVLADNAKVVPYHARLDKIRHKAKMNVAFADGHVESPAI